MKIFFPFLMLIFAFQISTAQYASQNITLLSNWSDPSIPAEPVYAIKYNSVWGWYDAVKKKEYAIIGTGPGVYIIDVTNPSAPVQKDFIPGRRDSCIWRELKTYQNYLYMVSDDGAPNSLMIADLASLPDSVTMVHDSDSIFSRSHTIYVDGNKLYCASVKSATGYFASMAVYSLANPAKPLLLRKLEDDFTAVSGGVHDMFVRNDTVYVSWANNGLYVFKFKSDNTFQLLGSLTSYPDKGYNHSSFLTPDGKTLVFCDEVPADLAVKVADVTDPADIKIHSTFKSNAGATPHNPYIIGQDKVVISYYQDGIQIYDISDPINPKRAGYFDTFPNNDTSSTYLNPPYQGCWGAYTDLPSGILLASDMQRGLFVLDPKKALGVQQTASPLKTHLEVFPNPFLGEMTLSVTLLQSHFLIYEISDITGKKTVTGKKVFPAGTSSLSINTEKFAPGNYLVKVTGEKISFISKVVRVE